MVFASFIRKAADVEAVRNVLGEDGKNIKVLSESIHFVNGMCCVCKSYRVEVHFCGCESKCVGRHMLWL